MISFLLHKQNEKEHFGLKRITLDLGVPNPDHCLRFSFNENLVIT